MSFTNVTVVEHFDYIIHEGVPSWLEVEMDGARVAVDSSKSLQYQRGTDEGKEPLLAWTIPNHLPAGITQVDQAVVLEPMALWRCDLRTANLSNCYLRVVAAEKGGHRSVEFLEPDSSEGELKLIEEVVRTASFSDLKSLFFGCLLSERTVFCTRGREAKQLDDANLSLVKKVITSLGSVAVSEADLLSFDSVVARPLIELVGDLWLVVGSAGAGGAGAAYNVELLRSKGVNETGSERVVAILKVGSEAFSSSESVAERNAISTEISTLRRLLDQESRLSVKACEGRIAPVLFGVSPAAPCQHFVSQRVGERSIQDEIDKHPEGLPLVLALCLYRQLLLKLLELGRAGLVHGDLSPSNIRFDEQQLWLIDFGSTRPIGWLVTAFTGDKQTASDSEIVCTPDYRRRGFRQYHQYSSRFDLFSATAIFFHCLLGKHFREVRSDWDHQLRAVRPDVVEACPELFKYLRGVFSVNSPTFRKSIKLQEEAIRSPLQAVIRLNEIVAALKDGSSEYDWLKLHNPTEQKELKKHFGQRGRVQLYQKAVRKLPLYGGAVDAVSLELYDDLRFLLDPVGFNSER